MSNVSFKLKGICYAFKFKQVLKRQELKQSIQTKSKLILVQEGS